VWAAADALGLPFVPPYWGGHSADYFAGGVNFAVGGATALSPEFLRENGVPLAADTVHLDMELDWFRDLLEQPNLLCPDDFAGMSGLLPSPSGFYLYMAYYWYLDHLQWFLMCLDWLFFLRVMRLDWLWTQNRLPGHICLVGWW
jgi:hypothetical protein